MKRDKIHLSVVFVASAICEFSLFWVCVSCLSYIPRIMMYVHSTGPTNMTIAHLLEMKVLPYNWNEIKTFCRSERPGEITPRWFVETQQGVWGSERTVSRLLRTTCPLNGGHGTCIHFTRCARNGRKDKNDSGRGVRVVGGRGSESDGVGEGRLRFVCRTRCRNDQTPRALEKPEVLWSAAN